MKNKRRYISILTVCVLLFFFTSCNMTECGYSHNTGDTLTFSFQSIGGKYVNPNDDHFYRNYIEHKNQDDSPIYYKGSIASGTVNVYYQIRGEEERHLLFSIMGNEEVSGEGPTIPKGVQIRFTFETVSYAAMNGAFIFTFNKEKLDSKIIKFFK